VIRVLAVDHNPLMREGLALLVRSQRDMALVGVAATAVEAVQVYDEQRPDVTLMDLDLPSGTALAAIKRIRARDLGAAIIGLTSYDGDRVRTRASAAGISHCAAKDRLSESLALLIRSAVTPESRG